MKNKFFTKAIALSLLICSASLLTNAQACIKKQHTLGGSGYDSPGDNILKVPGGIVVPGYTNSTDGNFNLPVSHRQDAYLIKYSAAGNVIWKHTYGGSGDDYFIWVSQTCDGGFIAIGGTYSNDGDVSGNHGGQDVWLVKLNSVGAIQWQRCYGGSSDDYGWQANQTSYGYVLVGTAISSDGNLTSNHGGMDAWYVKLSHTGNILFQKSFGGSADDQFVNIVNNPDGSNIISGITTSNDFDISGNHGSDDSWLVKISAAGNVVWQDVLGGSGEDVCNGMARLNDGNIIIGHTDNSNDGDVTDNHGGFDAWIVKINPVNGNVIWKKSFGDALDQGSYGGIIATADGGALSFGFDGDFASTNFTGDNVLAIKMTTNGVEQWQNTFGGSDEDDAVAAVETAPGQYAIGVESLSNDGDVHNAHGDFDSWLIWIGNCSNHREFKSEENNFSLSSFPNPFSTSITITFSLSQSQNVSLNIFDVTGKLVATLAESEFTEGEHQIKFNAENVNAGIYFLKLNAGDYSQDIKLSIVK